MPVLTLRVYVYVYVYESARLYILNKITIAKQLSYPHSAAQASVVAEPIFHIKEDAARLPATLRMEETRVIVKFW